MELKNSDKKYNEIINEILSLVDGETNFILSSRFLDKKTISVFKDEELMNSAIAFFDSNLNVSETSKNTFMHRNTLIYRIEKIHKITGLNIRKLNDAVTFITLKAIYDRTQNIR